MSDFVLIVDDDPLVVEVITEFLSLMGIQCRAAQNGREAMEMIRTERPKAIILDLLMPLVNGFSTLSQLAKDEGTPIPVIILSGISDQMSVVQMLPGVTGTMVKGRFTFAELQALLTTAGVLEDPASMASRRLPAPSSSEGKTGPLRALPERHVETSTPIQGSSVVTSQKAAETPPAPKASSKPGE